MKNVFVFVLPSLKTEGITTKKLRKIITLKAFISFFYLAFTK